MTPNEAEKTSVISTAKTDAVERTLQGEQTADPRQILVERILCSRSLGKSELLGHFLRYICDRQIRGRESEITEQQIGVRVFGRSEGYNSNDDNIVRTYARTLRKRLGDYFRQEGCEEPMLLYIPIGGYVPVFTHRDITNSSVPVHLEVSKEIRDQRKNESLEVLRGELAAFSSLGALNGEESGSKYKSLVPAFLTHRQWFPLLFVLTTSTMFLGFVLGFSRNMSRLGATKSNPILWSQLFTDSRDTFIVPADGGLVMMQSFTKEKVKLADYVNGTYRSDSTIDSGVRGLIDTARPQDQTKLVHKVSVLAARRYTSVADLALTTRLAQLEAVFPQRLVIRFARDLRMDDLHTGNAILLGSSDANPWVSLFEQQLNFQFSSGNEFGGSGTIRNTHPLPGEQSTYASITGDPSNATYGVIAYVPNLENTGHVLLVEGLNMAGTQAAGEFLLRPERMQPLIEKALDRKGRLQAFEVLLKTTNIAANASSAEVLSERVHTSTNP